VRPSEDDRSIINFSIWEDLSSLRDFVFRSAHTRVMKCPREWVERLTDEYHREKRVQVAGTCRCEERLNDGSVPGDIGTEKSWPCRVCDGGRSSRAFWRRSVIVPG
jgi:hypothetical protein